MGSNNKESLKIEAIMSVNWLQVGVSVLGTFAGVLLAFQLDRLWERRLNRKKALEFLELIKKELQDNLKTLDYLLESLEQRKFDAPFFAVRFDSWRTFLDRLPLVRKGLRPAMLEAYYELETHNRTVGLYRGLVYATIKRGKNAEPDWLSQSIAEHRAAIFEQIRGKDKKGGMLHSMPILIEKIDAEIDRLSDC
jgi:hypothetical protein